MPRVPRVPQYDETQVNEAALPGARVSDNTSIETFGGGDNVKRMSQAVKNVSDVATEVGNEYQQRMDQARLLEERRAVNDIENKYRETVKSRQGRNAFGVDQEVLPEFDKEIEERKKGLANQRQKQAFDQFVLARREGFHDFILGHQSREIDHYEEGEFKANLKSSSDRAISNPEAIHTELEFGRRQIAERAKQKGWGNKETEQLMRAHATDIHTGRIDQFLSQGLDQEAKGYFEAVKGSLDQEQAAKLEKHVMEENINGDAKRAALSIARKRVGLESALQMVESNKELQKNPKRLEATLKEVQDYYARHEKAQDLAQKHIYQQASNLIDQGMTYDNLPPQIKRNLTEGAKDSLRNARKDGEKTDPVVYQRLVNMSTGDRENFKKLDLATTQGLAWGEREKLIDMQAKLLKGDEKADKLLNGLLSDQQIVMNRMKLLDIDPKSEKGLLLMNKVHEEVNRLQKQTKKKVTDDDMRQILDRQLVHGRTDDGFLGSGFFETEKFEFERNPSEEFKDVDVPEADRLEIEAILKKRGKPVTPESVSQIYKRGLKSGG